MRLSPSTKDSTKIPLKQKKTQNALCFESEYLLKLKEKISESGNQKQIRVLKFKEQVELAILYSNDPFDINISKVVV